MTTTTYATGPGGWLRADGAWVRFADEDGRLVPTQVVLGSGPGEALDTDALRSVPLGRIQAWANGPGADGLRASLDSPAPDPAAELAQAMASPRRAARGQGLGRKRLGTFTVPVLDVPTTRDKGDDFYRAVAAVYTGAAAEGRPPAMAIATAAAGGLAIVPQGEDEDPAAAVERVLPPRSTVNRWIRECRRRGFLPPGRTGKVG